MKSATKICEVCNVLINPRGWAGHIRSPLHKKLNQLQIDIQTAYANGFAAGRDHSNLNSNTQTENSNLQQFTTGAVRRKTEPCRLDLIPLEALQGYGDRLHYGATVRGYGPRNWEKGIDYANLIQHAQEHLSRLSQQLVDSQYGLTDEWKLKQTDEFGNDTPYGNACALLWNAGAIVTFLRRGNPAEKKES